MSIDKSKLWTILKMSHFGDDELKQWDISCDSSGVRELGGRPLKVLYERRESLEGTSYASARRWREVGRETGGLRS